MNGKTDENHYKWPDDMPKPGWLKKLFFYHDLKIDSQTHGVIGVRARVRMFPKLLLIGGTLSAGILGYESLDNSVTENRTQTQAVKTILGGKDGIVVNLRDVKDALYGSDVEKYPQTPLGRIEKDLGEIKKTLNNVNSNTEKLPEVRYKTLRSVLDKDDGNALTEIIRDYVRRRGGRLCISNANDLWYNLTDNYVPGAGDVNKLYELCKKTFPEWDKGMADMPSQFTFVYK